MNSIINSCMKFSRYIRVSETISCIFYTSGLIDHAIQESLFLDRIIDKRLISLLKIRQPPIFPGRLQPSIVGRSELNFRVRNGNGWTLALISTNLLSFEKESKQRKLHVFYFRRTVFLSLPPFSTAISLSNFQSFVKKNFSTHRLKGGHRITNQ